MKAALALLSCLLLVAQGSALAQETSRAQVPVTPPLSHGSFLFADLGGCGDVGAERSRLTAVIEGFGATVVGWDGGPGGSMGDAWLTDERVYFSGLDVERIPELVARLEYRPDAGAPGGRLRVHQLLDCAVDGVLGSLAPRVGIELVVTIVVAPGARLFYPPIAGGPEREVRAGKDGVVRIAVRLARGQESVYARTEQDGGPEYIKASIFEEAPTRVSEEEYRREVTRSPAQQPSAPTGGQLQTPENAGPGVSVEAGTRAGEAVVGPDGGAMVWVPAGEFMMGSADNDGFADEHPRHRVVLSKGFWVGRCEVTNQQYRAFCEATGAVFPSLSTGGPQHPVVGVSWDDAQAYCLRYGLALPTEAQWEYVARGPEGRKFPWGNEWDATKCCNVSRCGPGRPPTVETGSNAAGVSWCGALDMAGNVWEWCADRYGSGYYGQSPGVDPAGMAAGDTFVRRGGSWDDGATGCRTAYRGNHVAGSRFDWLGFRCIAAPQ